jgi:hypothetical protein
MKMLASICGMSLCVLGVGLLAVNESPVDCQEIGEVLAESVEADQLTWLQAQHIVERCLANHS